MVAAPDGLRWHTRCDAGAMIVVDLRFTRTAANTDLFLQTRAGLDPVGLLN